MNSEYVPWLLAAGALVALTILKRWGGISSERARELVQAGAKLVDVRSPGEFASGHIPGALNVPVTELGSRLQQLGSKENPVIVYCASGTRSAVARSMLKGHGFAQVFNLGSMSRWQS